MLLLAGDIGGTHTRLVLIDSDAPFDAPRLRHRYPSRAYPTFEAIVVQFLGATSARPDAAAFGVAGPAIDDRAKPSNLEYAVDAAVIRERFGIERVAVRNDLVTTGLGVTLLPPAAFRVLAEGRPDPRGNAALIAAGTGLGEAILTRVGTRFEPQPSEGGHGDFGPRDEEQDALVKFLRGRFGQASRERVVAGPSILSLWEFRGTLGDAEDPDREQEIRRASAKDAPAIITGAALSGASARCGRALDLFVRAYAQCAQSLALTALATGGVYVGGGIAPKILPALAGGAFVTAFRSHPVLGEMLAAMPLKVVLDDSASLLGAVAVARGLTTR
jgi:glucokinase